MGLLRIYRFIIAQLLVLLPYVIRLSNAALQSEKGCVISDSLKCEIIDLTNNGLLQMGGDDDTRNNKTSSPSSIDWKELKPTSVRTFVLYKTNPVTLDLMLRTSIRWRLPLIKIPQDLLQPIEGFTIRIESNSTSSTKLFLAKFDSPIQTLTRNYSYVEFFYESTTLLEFDEAYTIEISLYPEGENGKVTISKEAMKRPIDDKCGKETKDIARFWAPTFTMIIAHEVTADVEVSFLPAPNSLCIKHYSLYIQSISSSQVLEYAMINATGNEKLLAYTFKGMPREEKLMIKLLATTPIKTPCVCTQCHCLTVKSDIFIIPNINLKAIPSPSLPMVSKSMVTAQGHLIFLTLLLLLGVFLGLFILILLVRYLVRKNRLLQKSVNILTLNSSENKEIMGLHEGGNNYKYSLLASPVTQKDIEIVNALAQIIRNSNHTLFYDKIDTANYAENVFRWYKHAITVADRILIIHCDSNALTIGQDNMGKNYPYALLNNIIADDCISLLDKRVIHMSLQNEIFLKYTEIVYNIPRDIALLPELLGVPINEDWIRLEKISNGILTKANDFSDSLSLDHRNEEISDWPNRFEITPQRTFDSGMHSINSQNMEETLSSENIIESIGGERQLQSMDSGIQTYDTQDFAEAVENYKDIPKSLQKLQNNSEVQEKIPLIR